MKNIVILGSGGFAKEVAFLIEDINKITSEWNILGYVDNNKKINNGKHSIVFSDDELLKYKEPINVVLGIGNPDLSEKIISKLKQNKNISYPTLIHPNVVGDFERIKLGEGNILCAGNILTTDIKIGKFNIFNLNNTIGHDASIGNFNVINPTCNLSGGVILKDKILLGTGSQILQYKSIESHSIIGAGSVVTKDITEAGVFVGTPAKRIK